MAWHPHPDGPRNVDHVPADSLGRDRVRDARVRRPLLHREQRAACVLDALPGRHVLEEGAGGAGTEDV